MSRPRHPKPAVENAVCYAEALGWRVTHPASHAWGRLFCPEASRSGCIVSVWSTPSNEDNHARQLRRFIDRCDHRVDDGG